MFLCRTAWQRCGHLTRKSAYQLSRDVLPRRQMSSLPGGTGDNIIYALLCGGAFAGAVAYTYSTVTTDHARFTDRVADINARPKTEWVPKPWPPKSEEAVADGEEAAAGEEPAAEEAVEAENVAELAEETEAVSEEPAVEAAVEEVAVVEAETVVEEVAEAVAEAAEVIAEVAEEVVEVAMEVEAAAEEVVIVAEAVEDAAEAIAVPAFPEEAVAVVEPESNGTATQEEVAPEAAVTAV
ncbi:protein MGARP isoform X5 [Oncorhynchus kisutch]|uniref:protein MGARP isoform X5 n=1 Tax=Oncorhynchus kisutch TaxID=8019 RepID=UPI0012DF74C1|nr:protein MGARP isoform X5 [Oncorhynchus kisutch]